MIVWGVHLLFARNCYITALSFFKEEDSCLELLPDVFEGSVSGDPCLELPPDVGDGYVSGDSCFKMGPPPEQ